MKCRDIYLDVLKGLGIFLVIFAHVLRSNFLVKVIYYFHMPLFFFISGITLFYTLKMDITFRQFLKKKAKSLLIAYFVFSILCFIYWEIFERKIRNQFNISIIANFINIFIGRADVNLYSFNVVMWFLPSLFICEILFFLLMKAENKYYKLVMILMSFISGLVLLKFNIKLPYGTELSLIGILFMLMGYIYKKNKKDIKLNYKTIILFVISILVLTISYIKGYSFDMLNHICNNYFMLPIVSLAGIYVIMVITIYIYIYQKYYYILEETL